MSLSSFSFDIVYFDDNGDEERRETKDVKIPYSDIAGLSAFEDGVITVRDLFVEVDLDGKVLSATIQ